MIEVEPSPQMWAVLLLTGLALVGYALERIPVELTALAILGALLVLFQIMPLENGALPPEELLGGLANPALVAVVALLVIGQAMVNTAAFEGLVRLGATLARGSFPRALVMSLASVTGISAVLNNTPVVVIFLPILRTLAERFGEPASMVMMPLSFAAVMGGMLTLIGSSSNLLVAGELRELGETDLGFFSITLPGAVLVTAAAAYILLVLPRLLPRRGEPGLAFDGKQFIAEIDVVEGSPLIGETALGGLFPSLTGVTVRLIQRHDRPILPPFEDVTLEAGDVVIVAATRKVLTEMLTKTQGQVLLTPGARAQGERPVQRRELMLAEAMVRPASRMIGQSLAFTAFDARTGCTVLGIQRRARMLRTRLMELRLEPGDVLLLLADLPALERLRSDPDVLLMEWSASEMPDVRRGPLALLIFAGVVLPAALGLMPIVITALVGAAMMIATGCLNVRQAARAVDRRIVLLIAAALALGSALEATGGAAWLAGVMIDIMAGAAPAAVLSAFFLLIAMLTNVLSNNACAVLFTPIAVNLAGGLGAPVFPFALAVIFGANCSFATPFGYQVNLLIMGPGQYRFLDFVRAGLPLILILWLVFSAFVPWYYGL
ncbi:MAG TPA: SLC13 family permease [Geminicoccaceae bacterium]